MSRIKRKGKAKETAFLNKIDALYSPPDERDRSALQEDFGNGGIDPEELRKTTHDKLRAIATHNYISLGKECPPRLKEALRQLKPLSPEEEEKKQTSQAASKINDLLSNIKSGVISTLSAPLSGNQAPAHAFRNKKKDLTQKDRDLLKAHQSEVDAEAEEETRDDD
jgi:hypothetical protein